MAPATGAPFVGCGPINHVRNSSNAGRGRLAVVTAVTTVVAVAVAVVPVVAVPVTTAPAGASTADLGTPASVPGPMPGPASVPVEPQSAAAALSPDTVIPPDTVSVRIVMTENNTLDVIVSSPGGVSAPGVANAPAVRFQRAAGGTWNVQTAQTCAGGEPTGAAPWSVQVGTGQKDPTASPVTASQLLTLCVGGGQSTNDHGTVTATYNATGQARTVNTLPLEQYIADTVPGESPSTWASLGGPGPQGQNWGFQELEAQAVAARSYVLANLGGYGGYADTCDLTCQTYRGTKWESAASIAAATDTAGQVMFMPTGRIATTEYSSSTGGYTSNATEQSPFTAVPDTGDVVAGNTHHNWTATVTDHWASTIGPTLTGITVTRRNGLGDWGGRAVTVVVNGTRAPKTMTAAQFVAATTGTGVQSNWFTVTAVSGGTATLSGHGWGHGIGMGQWGALGYAIGQDNGQGNWTYQQIVTHYYGPATLGNLPGPAATPGAGGGVGGYWLAAADGGIFSFGNAHFDGSMGGQPLNQPVVGLAATPDDGGYWEVATDGGMFSFGDAHFYGSMGGQRLNQPIVGMAPTADGAGYWLVAADGGIFAFGDAVFHGSTGSLHLVKPVVGMAPTADGAGYWLVASDGGIFAFGDAHFYGSAAGTAGGSGATGLAATADGAGYLLVTTAGKVTAFGDAPQLGDLTTAVAHYGGRVVGLVTTAG
ncbi:MAG TPA: SpoIID/LytB domain-containing protein [Acidimicrobiales bacterium]|nr:SpoIID/LytB domain-containing protein [Acidimicrobiales bacterium]